ncbi:hypothetical protein [Streptomyces sp. NPDC058086]|uniref:hypothetical protein n=1 Tax=Streptomyces sp. NPDC058086 TaxID=3346334 RepID=UPI0036E28CC6
MLRHAPGRSERRDHTRWPAGVVVTEDPGPELPPLLQPPGITTNYPPLRSMS